MKKQLLSVLLCLAMALGLLPTMVFASGVPGSGTKDDPYIYEVSTAPGLSAAVTAINEDLSDSAHYYTISLQKDIECNGLSFSGNTTTILGNGHTLTFKKYGGTIQVGSGTATHPVLILGGAQDTLTIEGASSNDTYFIGVGAINGGTEYGTLKMYDGVTITGATGNNYFGGAVTVAGGGTFEMNGGTIKKCGIDGGSVCFGGGVAVINGGEFTMNGGSIQDCFLKTAVDYTNASYLQYVFGFDYQAANNLLVNSGAGAGVFVSNGAVFKMNGGEIKNNTISTQDESVKSYGVGGGIAVLANMDSLDITARVEVTGGTIEGNKATLGGGGIAVCGMMPFAYAISNSYAPGSGSGTTTPGLVISGTEENPVQIKNNSADGWEYYSVGGGGILLANLNDAAKVQIKNAEISGNKVTTNAPGGGIECWSNISTRLYSRDLTANHLTVTNTVMNSNSAAKGGGICLYNDTSTGTMEAKLSNTVITGNTATELGGGFSVEANSNDKDSTAVTFNESCAVYDNTADSGADDFYKNGNSTVNVLPTAEQMSAAAKNAVISGWYKDEEGNRYSKDNASEYTPEPSTTESLQLKAVKAAQYAVTFDWNDGSSRTETVSALAGTALGDQMPAAPTRSGYTFTGWTTQADGQGTVFNKDTVVNGTLTVYAQWSKNSGGGGSTTTYYYFAIEKVDAQDGHALNGAKFGLYLDGKQVATATSNRSGIAMFRVNESDYRKINAKSDLYYQELTAPEGYVVNSDEVSIEKSNLTTSWSKAEKDAETVRNYRGTTPDLLNGDDHFAYVVGYQDGCVHPNALITRAETATIFFRLLKDDVRDGNLLTSNTYTDVADDYWANTAISTMTGLGIVQGHSADTFDPKAPITRAQFAAICARFDTGKTSGTQTFTDIKGHWAEKYIERAAELGWIKGFEDGTFRPDTYITRAQAMTMINRVLNRIPEENSDLLAGMNIWPDCNPGDWFYLAVQEATNSHAFKHKAGNYETWTGMNKNPDWTRYEH